MLRNLILLTLLLISSVTFAESKSVAIIVLNKDFPIVSALDYQYQMGVKAMYKEALPNHRIEIITNWPFQSTEDFAEQITQKLNPDDKITHLLISDHAATKVENGEVFTAMSGLGRIYEERVDEVFAQRFGPLKGRLTPDAKVVFGGCRVFCDSVESVQRRASQIANFFGLKEGTVFGSTVNMVGGVPRNTSYQDIMLINKIGWPLIGLMFIGSAIWGGEAVMNYAQWAAPKLMVMVAAFALFRVIPSDAQNENKGFLVKFNQGKFDSMEEVNWVTSNKEIFFEACAKALTP